jgi:hypothetical protein
MNTFHGCRRPKFDKNHLCNTQYLILLTAACIPTIHREGIVALALQKWLIERVTISCYTNTAYSVRNYTRTLLVNFLMVAKNRAQTISCCDLSNSSYHRSYKILDANSVVIYRAKLIILSFTLPRISNINL